MTQPDVNVLVYAYRREAAQHQRYAAWLAALVRGPEELGLADAVLTGFLRIVTNPRVVADPAPTTEAMRFVDAVRDAPRSRPVRATDATWRAFARITAADRQVRGNLVPDAWLAALAISHGARVATSDRGFARYDGLDWFDPVTAEPR